MTKAWDWAPGEASSRLKFPKSEQSHNESNLKTLLEDNSNDVTTVNIQTTSLTMYLFQTKFSQG